MSLLSGTRLQAALAVILFLASLAALLLNGVWPLLLPGREARVRATLREASRRLAQDASPVAADLAGGDGLPFDDLSRRLRQVTARALADFPASRAASTSAAATALSATPSQTSRLAPTRRQGGMRRGIRRSSRARMGRSPRRRTGRSRSLHVTTRRQRKRRSSAARHSRASACRPENSSRRYRTSAPAASPA